MNAGYVFGDESIKRNTGIENIAKKLSIWRGVNVELLLNEFLGDKAYMIDIEQFKRHGLRKLFPDGREEFSYDGKPLFEVMPLEFAKEGDKYMVSQRINKLYGGGV